MFEQHGDRVVHHRRIPRDYRADELVDGFATGQEPEVAPEVLHNTTMIRHRNGAAPMLLTGRHWRAEIIGNSLERVRGHEKRIWSWWT